MVDPGHEPMRVRIGWEDRFTRPQGFVREDSYFAPFSGHALSKDGVIAASFFADALFSHEFAGVNDTSKNTRDLWKIADKTGEGLPDVMLMGFTGGAHCCFQLWVYELGHTIHSVEPIELYDSEIRAMRRHPTEDGVVFSVRDYSFDYWNAPYSNSPSAPLLVRALEEGVEIQFDLMKAPPPSDASFIQRMEQVSAPRLRDEAHPAKSDSEIRALIEDFNGRLPASAPIARYSALWGVGPDPRLALSDALSPSKE